MPRHRMAPAPLGYLDQQRRHEGGRAVAALGRSAQGADDARAGRHNRPARPATPPPGTTRAAPQNLIPGVCTNFFLRISVSREIHVLLRDTMAILDE